MPISHHRSLPIYVGAGGIATAPHYALSEAVIEAAGMPPLDATVCGFARGVVVKYLLNYFAALHEGERLHCPLGQALFAMLLIPSGYQPSRC